MKIIMDFDSVLVDSIQSFIDCYRLKYHRHKDYIEPDLSKMYKWDFSDICGLLKSWESEAIFESDEFWEMLTINKGAQKFMQKHRDKTIICSNGTMKNMQKKLKFLDKHFNGIAVLPQVKSMENSLKLGKSIVNMENAIFIDDNVFNLKSSNAKYEICFADRGVGYEWNEGYYGRVVQNFEELDKTVDVLLRIENNKGG